MAANNASALDSVSLRPMAATDLAAAHALSTELRWPHRMTDWEHAFRHGDGLVAERAGQVVGTALCWRWGRRHATIGLVMVAPAYQGRRVGYRLMNELLGGLGAKTVLLQATSEGRGVYERLGFIRIGELRQHQGVALPSPPVALDAGWRLRPAVQNDRDALVALDTQARGMPRGALIADLFAQSDANVVLDRDGQARGFAMLRRFGRGHVIGPVVAGSITGAKALIAHLSGQNAGRFTRIDIDADTGLGQWLEDLGLLRVDAPMTMLRGPALASAPDMRLCAVVTQALG